MDCRYCIVAAILSALDSFMLSETQADALDQNMLYDARTAFADMTIDIVVHINPCETTSLSPASGIAILMYHRWIGSIKQTIYLNDRVMTIDLHVSQKTIHVGYARIHFQDFFDDIERLVI